MAREQDSAPDRGYRKSDRWIMLVCVLAAGAAVYWRASGEWAELEHELAQLDTPESATLYVCPHDGATLNVTPAAFERMLRCGHAGPPEGAPPRTRGFYLRCPTCEQRIMVQGTRCPAHGTAFALADADGQPCMCPLCLAETYARTHEPQPDTDEAG